VSARETGVLLLQPVGMALDDFGAGLSAALAAGGCRTETLSLDPSQYETILDRIAEGMTPVVLKELRRN
jgi:hypothetical protein